MKHHASHQRVFLRQGSDIKDSVEDIPTRYDYSQTADTGLQNTDSQTPRTYSHNRKLILKTRSEDLADSNETSMTRIQTNEKTSSQPRRQSDSSVSSYLVGRRFSLSRDVNTPPKILEEMEHSDGVYRPQHSQSSSFTPGHRSLFKVGMPAGFTAPQGFSRTQRRYSIQTETPSRQISQISGSFIQDRRVTPLVGPTSSIRSVPSSPVSFRKQYTMRSTVIEGGEYGRHDDDFSCHRPVVSKTKSYYGSDIGNEALYSKLVDFQDQGHSNAGGHRQGYGSVAPFSSSDMNMTSQPQLRRRSSQSNINISTRDGLQISINTDQPLAMIGRANEGDNTEFALFTTGEDGSAVPILVNQIKQLNAQPSIYPHATNGWGHSPAVTEYSQSQVHSHSECELPQESMGPKQPDVIPINAALTSQPGEKYRKTAAYIVSDPCPSDVLFSPAKIGDNSSSDNPNLLRSPSPQDEAKAIAYHVDKVPQVTSQAVTIRSKCVTDSTSVKKVDKVEYPDISRVNDDYDSCKAKEEMCDSVLSTSDENTTSSTTREDCKISDSMCQTDVNSQDTSVGKQKPQTEGSCQTEGHTNVEDVGTVSVDWVSKDAGTCTSPRACPLNPIISELSIQEIRYDVPENVGQS